MNQTIATGARKYVAIEDVIRLYREAESLSEAETTLKHLPCRRKNPPPPPGSIAIGPASRKYHLPKSTISRWVQKGLVTVVLRSTRYKYIDEGALAEVVRQYRENPGQGKQTLRRAKEHE